MIASARRQAGAGEEREGANEGGREGGREGRRVSDMREISSSSIKTKKMLDTENEHRSSLFRIIHLHSLNVLEELLQHPDERIVILRPVDLGNESSVLHQVLRCAP